jgi:hypothetical protein
MSVWAEFRVFALIEQWLTDLDGDRPVIQGTGDLGHGEVSRGLPNIAGINEDWHSVAVSQLT